MLERRVWRIHRTDDNIVTEEMISGASVQNCPEIEFRDDISESIVYSEFIKKALTVFSTPLLEGTISTEYSYTPVIEGDSEGILVWSKIAGPSDMSIVSGTGVVTWTPDTEGTYNVVLRAEDDAVKLYQDYNIIVI